ncbi:MAG: hypothetical protein U0990_09655 [Candidatus Nanopelagicales bacterium]|nr:hypothetical protein [Candidatus Nanopelagicales bacterium]
MSENSVKPEGVLRLWLEVRDVDGRVEVGFWEKPDTESRQCGALRVALSSLIRIAQANEAETGRPWIASLIRAGLATPTEHRRAKREAADG